MASVLKKKLDNSATDFPTEAVREELTRILESPEFSATPRRRELLQYLVEEMLAGRGNAIKGYTIAVSVFDRGEDFDPDSDPVVRLEARRLRHDLDSYYVSEGRDNALRISIPKGRYVPTVTAQNDAPPAFIAEQMAGGLALHVANIEDNPNAALPSRHWKVAAAISVGVAAILVLANLLIDHRPTGNANSEVGPPAVAILPFEVLSTSEQDRFLATGISNRVAAELNRYPDIRIYSPMISSAQMASSDTAWSATRSNVSYLVAGSLRTDGSTIEVSARLVETKTDQMLWAETYERVLNPESLAAIQGDIAGEIASKLGQSYGVIRNEITRNLSEEFVPTMPSYECVLRAYQYRRVLPAHDLAGPVMDCLQKAVTVDPQYPEAWALLGFLYMDAVRFNRVGPAEAEVTFAKAIDAASRATALDPDNITGLQALGAINFYQGHYEEGERFARLALEQNPNDPESLVQLGWRMAVRGKFEEGIPLVERAIARSVSPPGWYHHTIALDRLMKNDGAGMLDAAQKSTLNLSPLSQAMVAMAYGLLGNEEAARDTLAQMNAMSPNYDPIRALRSHQATDEIIKAATAALHRAGWTEPGQS